MATNARDLALAHATLRVALGFNFLMHGVSRVVSGVDAFAHGLAQGFASTPLPVALAYRFALPLPYVELGLGVLLVLGVFTRVVLLATSALLLALTFGVSLQAKWDVAASQLSYQVVIALVLATLGADRFSLDARRRSR